jgi:hypothetical protein
MLDQHIPAQYYVLSQMKDYKDILTFIPQLPSSQWVTKLTPTQITHPHELTLIQEQFSQLHQHISMIISTQLHSQIIAHLVSVHNEQLTSNEPAHIYQKLQEHPHPYYSSQVLRTQELTQHIKTIQTQLHNLQKSL